MRGGWWATGLDSETIFQAQYSVLAKPPMIHPTLGPESRYRALVISNEKTMRIECGQRPMVLRPSSQRRFALIIDTHTHFYDPSRPQGVPWPPKDDALLYRTVLPAHYRALAEPRGVSGTVVVEASEWLEDNAWVLALAASEPFIVGLVGHIVPGRPEFAAELARFAANPLLRGIRCRPGYFADLPTEALLRDLALLVKYDLELDAMVQESEVDRILAVAQRLPELRIVLNHTVCMPVDGGPVTPEWLGIYARLAAEPNIHLKVSAVLEMSVVQPAPTDLDTYRPGLDAMFNAFGEDRVIYGSNWPVSDRASSFADALGVVKAYCEAKGSAVADKYFCANSKRVYKWLDRG